MNNKNTYRNLEVWKLSICLAEKIYRFTDDFPSRENFGMTSQLRRSAVSVSNNICEGKGRMTTGEFRRFLAIARGSSYEISNLLELSKVLGYGKPAEIETLFDLNDKISAMLSNLIKTLKATEKS